VWCIVADDEGGGGDLPALRQKFAISTFVALLPGTITFSGTRISFAIWCPREVASSWVGKGGSLIFDE
jgi:hypothetical protein